MGFSRNVKNVFVKPYKAFTNKIIPIVNVTNNYLDSLFPSDKYNWRKIAVGWAILQAFVITILEIIVAYKNIKQVNEVYTFHLKLGDKETLRKLSGVDSLAVYHMIFIVAQFFQFYLICDTISKSSTIQLIIGTLFSIGIGGYSVIQFWQATKGVSVDNEIIKKIIEENNIQEDPKNIIQLHTAKYYEILIIILMAIFCIGWIIISLRLYKVFGWNVFKQLGADIGVKNRLKICQIFLALLKIDIFFFTAFSIQIFVFVVTNINNTTEKMVNSALLVVNFIILFMGFFAIKKESYVLMSIFIILLSISIGYMSYNVMDVVIDSRRNERWKDKKYRNCSISISMACYSSIVAGIITFILALFNFKNFPKGLTKDKSYREATSNTSTLSSSNGKRWSIE